MLALLDHTLACRLSFLVETDEKERTCQCCPYLSQECKEFICALLKKDTVLPSS